MINSNPECPAPTLSGLYPEIKHYFSIRPTEDSIDSPLLSPTTLLSALTNTSHRMTLRS